MIVGHFVMSLYYSMLVGHLVVVPLLGRLLVVAHGHGDPGGVGAEQGHQPAHSWGVELQHHQHWTIRNGLKPQISMHEDGNILIWVRF